MQGSVFSPLARSFHLLFAKIWDVFLVDDPGLHDRINHVCHLLGAGGVREPNIDFYSVYTDGIRGIVNGWEDYPHSQDTAPPLYSEIYECYESKDPVATERPRKPPELLSNPAPAGELLTTGKRKHRGTPPERATQPPKHPRQVGRADAKAEKMFRGELAVTTAEMLRTTRPDRREDSVPPEGTPVAIARPVSDDLLGTTVPDTTTPEYQTLEDLRPVILEGNGDEGPSHLNCTLSCHAKGGGLYFNLIQFLLHALRRDANANETYLDHLLAMGRHVNRQDKDAFLDVMCCCLCDLSERPAHHTLPSPQCAQRSPSAPAWMRNRVRALSRWIMCELSVSTCLSLDRQFDGAYAVIAEKADTAGLLPPHAADACAEFRVREAEILAAAFCTAADDFQPRHGKRRDYLELCAGCIARLAS